MSFPVVLRISTLKPLSTSVLTAAIAFCATAALAAPQSNLVKERGSISKMLREGTIDKEPFEKYFNEFFQQLASPTADFPRIRKDLRIFFATASKQKAAHDALNAFTLKMMSSVVRSTSAKISNAAKYSAMLIIGELNEEEAESNSPAKPLPAAYKILEAAAKSTKVRDEIKLAALIGLDRFAAAGAVPADKKSLLTKTMLELVNQHDPPPGRTQGGHDWIRRSAAQVLASLGSPGPDNSVVKALEAITEDPQAGLALRCDAAQFIGQLKYPAGSKTNLQELANALGHQAVGICKQEIEDAKSDNPATARRVMIYALYSTLAGLEGSDRKGGLLAAATDAKQKEFIENVRSKTSSLYVTVDGAELSDDTLDDVQAKLSALEGTLAPLAPKKEVGAAEKKAPAQDDAQASVERPRAEKN